MAWVLVDVFIRGRIGLFALANNCDGIKLHITRCLIHHARILYFVRQVGEAALAGHMSDLRPRWQLLLLGTVFGTHKKTVGKLIQQGTRTERSLPASKYPYSETSLVFILTDARHRSTPQYRAVFLAVLRIGLCTYLTDKIRCCCNNTRHTYPNRCLTLSTGVRDMPLEVGIVGAGIGGLSAAIGLRRAGAHVEVGLSCLFLLVCLSRVIQRRDSAFTPRHSLTSREMGGKKAF